MTPLDLKASNITAADKFCDILLGGNTAQDVI